MKYIRTEDGRILKIGEQTDIGYEKGCLAIHNRAEIVDTCDPIVILKESHNIIDLCDDLIVVDIETKTCCIHGGADELDEIKEVMNKHGFQFKKNCEIYGAIWTRKGFIIIAKMNEKGELELL